MKSKDTKRFLSVSEKSECLAAAGYRCQGAACTNRDLTSQSYEFHHIKPHSQLGQTSRYNTSVLCKPCHKAAHKSLRVEQFSSSGWESLREWQRDAVDRFTESDIDEPFVLEAAPGAGKSRFAAFASKYAIDEMGMDHVIFIAPWLPILTSVKKNFAPLSLEVRDKFHYEKSRGVLQRIPDVEITLDTYAGFCSQTTVDVIEDWKRRSQFDFMLILDEIHHTNTVGGKWGPHVERIASLASKLVVMSGTYFRSDNRPIAFLAYDESDRPKTHFSIGVPQCVRLRYTRQVSFRFHDPELEVFSTQKNKIRRVKLSKVPTASPKMNSVAKKEVLDPKGPHVGALIADAWKELSSMRAKWPDAACLVVCRSGSQSDEERAIHAVESRIKELTGQRPEVVTSNDATARGRLDAFGGGSDPFLCAIRMVSEGVDIPRIRMVLFLSYTDSEMLFRQIVGRCCRYIDGKEDDTAALVILPKFGVMADFAGRFEAEVEQGILNRIPIGGSGTDDDKPLCPACELAPCECPCRKCGYRPCRCFIVLDSEPVADGGQIASSLVSEEYIQRAKIIRDSSSAHQHANVVQLGDALQRSAGIGSQMVVSNVEDRRKLAWSNVERKVKILARLSYGNDFQSSWKAEVNDPFNANAAEIKSTWRLERINELHAHLKIRIQEVCQHA